MPFKLLANANGSKRPEILVTRMGRGSMVPHTESEAWATPGASVHGNHHCGAGRELEVTLLISGQGFLSQRKI